MSGSRSATAETIQIQTAEIRIRAYPGSPLLCDRLPQFPVDGPQKSQDITSVAKFHQSYYLMNGNGEVPTDLSPEFEYGFPASGFKSAIVAACRFHKAKMSEAKGSIFVRGEPPNDYVRLTGIGGASIVPTIHHSMSRNQRGNAIAVTYARFDDWEAVLDMSWWGGKYTPNDIAQLVALAGEFVGIGVGRPGQTGRNYGKWTLAQ